MGSRRFLPLRTPELEASLRETFDENAILADDDRGQVHPGGFNMILGIFKMRQGPLPRRAGQLAIAMRALSTDAQYPG